MVEVYKKKHVAFFVVKDDGPQRLVQRAVFTRERETGYTHEIVNVDVLLHKPDPDPDSKK